MAQYLSQKLHLVVDFLFGARLPETHSALLEVGWSAEKLELGWRLVERAGRARFSGEKVEADRTDAELAAFQKRWFSVARIALRKRSPALAERLLGNADLRGRAIAAFVVGPFLKVLVEFETSALAEERRARELLAERGLTAEVAREAVRLVDRAQQVTVTGSPESFLRAEAQAEEELWDFYQEWSALARRSINNRNLLRLLGLNKAGRPAGSLTKPEPVVRVLQSFPALPPGPGEKGAGVSEKDARSEKKITESATADRSGRDTF